MRKLESESALVRAQNNISKVQLCVLVAYSMQFFGVHALNPSPVCTDDLFHITRCTNFRQCTHPIRSTFRHSTYSIQSPSLERPLTQTSLYPSL